MMPRLTELAHEAVQPVLTRGEIAIDATAGNGRDTLFLADRVGPDGRVFAFDLQPEALERCHAALNECDNVTFFLRDHAELAGAIPAECRGRVGAVMFNLGYLPGGNKSIITRTETTCRALAGSLDVLRPGGVLTVVAYTGHPGGREEAEAVAHLLAELPADRFAMSETRGAIEHTPRLFVVRKAGFRLS